jgi:cyclic pyranopterin phosphate synthase
MTPNSKCFIYENRKFRLILRQLKKESMNKKFTHLTNNGNPTMVDVGEKAITERIAIAQTIVVLPLEIIENLENNDIHTKKGAVFQTAILAGIMGAKKTSDLIPLCHPLPLTKVNIDIKINENKEVVIECLAKTKGQTGVEMEALTGATVAALTIYDMCKGFSQDIVIRETKLMRKSGGKTDFER